MRYQSSAERLFICNRHVVGLFKWSLSLLGQIRGFGSQTRYHCLLVVSGLSEVDLAVLWDVVLEGYWLWNKWLVCPLPRPSQNKSRVQLKKLWKIRSVKRIILEECTRWRIRCCMRCSRLIHTMLAWTQSAIILGRLCSRGQYMIFQAVCECTKW